MSELPELDDDAESVRRIKRLQSSVIDEPGEFRWIPKALLRIDRENYQRGEVSPKVDRMSKHWSHIAAGAISVSDRADGFFYVMDGQQRYLAAMRRPDILKLPCMVFRELTIREEAAGFLRMQTERNGVTMVEKFKALLTVEDKAAMEVMQLIDESKRKIEQSATGVRCVGSMRRLAQRDLDLLKRIWPIVDKISEGRPIHNHLLEGLAYIEDKVIADGVSLSDRYWRERLISIGYTELMNAISKATKYYNVGGTKPWALGLLERINYRLINKLPMKSTFDAFSKD